MLSIPSYKSEDPNYRYKMPRLVAKVEGRGNGIKTNIVNMGDIARALKRPPEYATRFCGHELGTSSKFESNEGKAIVNGAHEQRDLQALIDKFIDKFVLCQKCSLPEIDLELRGGRVGYNCNACGDRGEVDNAHKLSTFILRNPPVGCDTTCGAGAAAANRKLRKGERQKLKAAAKQPDAANSADEEKEKKPRKKHSGSEEGGAPPPFVAAPGDFNQDVLDQGDEDGVDEKKHHRKQKRSSKEEKKKKRKSKKDGEAEEPIEELTFDSPEVLSMTKLMVDFAKDSHGGELNKNIAGTEFYRELNLVRITNGASQRVAYFVALNALFHESFGVAFDPAGVLARASLLLAVARSMKPKDVLCAFEDFTQRRGALKQYPYLLQKLYDEDIIEERDLMRRYDPSRASDDDSPVLIAARAAAQPFLQWLADSDGDSDSDDDPEEEEDDLDKTEQQRLGNVTMKSLHRPQVTAVASKPPQQQPQQQQRGADEDGDDNDDDDDDDSGSEVDVDAI